MIEEELIALYKKTKKQLATLMEDMTFTNFFRALQSGKRAYTVKNTQIKKSIDDDWVNAIKDCIPHLDAIVNNPRRYMKRENEVVPVEKARIVDSDSVKHLAAHTNLIHSVKNGEVRPNKILTAFNDESIELYENRFVMTLILRVSQFVDRRYFLLGTGGNEFSSTVQIDGTFEQAGENTDYGIKMTVHQGADYFDGGISTQVYEDLYMAHKYVNSFKYSPFMKAMSGAAQVRPPIMNTNLLAKEPHYHACFKLWEFIDNYDKIGYKIEVNDSAPMLDRDFAEDFDAVDLLMYVAMKKKMGEFDGRRRAMSKCEKRVVKPTLEEFEVSSDVPKAYDISMGLRSALSGSGKRDTEDAIKDVLLRALRKERVRREMEEVEQREKDKQLESVVQEALSKQKEQCEEEKKAHESQMAEAIREALKAQHERERQERAAEKRNERRVANVLTRRVEQFREDERDRRANERREEKERDELMGAILQDLLRIEEERDYIRTSPLVLDGGERLPVPVSGERLPATSALIEKLGEYEEMLAPPLTLTDEDWEEMARAKAEGRRPRRRIGEDKLFGAIEEALFQARKKRRREADKRRRDAQKAEDAAFAAAESAATGAGPVERELSDDEILDVLNRAGRKMEGKATETEDGEPSAREKETPGNENGAAAHAGGSEKDEGTDKSRSKALAETDEVSKSFWRRLFEILFFWWRKK